MMPAADEASKRPVWLAASLLWLVVILVWRGTVDAPFVHDDLVHIVDREQQVVAPWSSWSSMAVAQRPMVQLTLGLNHLVGGLDPRGYHALNIALHAAAAVLCMFALWTGATVLLRRGAIDASPGMLWIGCVVAALAWALHPVQTASVSYVIQRAEILVALGALAAAIGIMRASDPGAQRRWSVVAVIGCWFAMLSKPTAVVVPAVVLAVDAAVSAGSFRVALRDRWRVHALCWASLVLMPALGVIQALSSSDGVARAAGVGVPGLTPMAYLFAQVGAIGVYAAELVRPALLSIDHGWTLLERPWPWAVGASVVAMVAVALTSGLRRDRWWWIVPALPTLVLLPSSSIVPLRDPVADHRLYLAMLGPVLAIGMAGLAVARRSRVAARAVVAVSAAIVAAEGVCTILRNDDWRHPERLWSAVLEQRPEDAKALINRSSAYLAAGLEAKARADAAAALQLRPADGAALAMLGLLDARAGRDEAALESLIRAEGLGVRTALVRGAMGDALRGLGRPCDAAIAYGKACNRSPSSERLVLLHGLSLSECGQWREAAAVLCELVQRTGDDGLRGRAQAILESMPIDAGAQHSERREPDAGGGAR